MKPFLQVITENTCRWPVESHWCGEAIHPNPYHPYCSRHLDHSRRKSTSHAELVEMINTQSAKNKDGFSRNTSAKGRKMSKKSTQKLAYAGSE